ncbi:MAG: hypothetical protein E4H40_07350 [Candidatus Brocadiia bacterium]|nr:MAG: hypothetical protein E4H40_07350 [Candidatus Brocadiia bacterium]
MAKKPVQHNLGCLSDSHNCHLCYMVSQGFHLTDEKEYKALVRSPKFKCMHCGRAANSEGNLCEPVKL